MQLDLPHVLMPGSLLHGATLQCRLGNRSLSLRAPRAVLRSLYAFDGSLTPRQWLDACAKRHWDTSAAAGLLYALVDCKILVCVHDLARQLWSHAENPRSMGGVPTTDTVLELVEAAQRRLATPAPPSSITFNSDRRAEPLHRLLRARVSSRAFGCAPIPPPTLTALLWAAAGVVGEEDRLRATTPSAGALYPLRHYYVNLRTTGDLAPGVYELCAGKPGQLHYVQCHSDLTQLDAAFSTPNLLAHAQGILVVCGDFAQSASKYGPRALSYVPLEAGHAAQNVLLAAAACDCHAVEIGGFIEQDLAALLRCEPSFVPITTVALGSTAPSRDTHDASEFEWVDVRDADGHRPFFLCRARAAPMHPWSWGRDLEPKHARLKATMESHERAALWQPRDLIRARFHDLTGAVDPTTILAYDAAQYRRSNFPYRPFDPTAQYLWKAARNVLNGSPCFVLADLVYLEEGLAGLLRPPPYTSANTSGAASHLSFEAALENAALELIERDAFMRLWLGAGAKEVNEAQLPDELKARIARLRALGVTVALRDIGHAYCHVAFCHAQSGSLHFTRVSSCAAYNFNSAMEHALMELESQVLISLHNPPPAPIRASQVRQAEDHAALYGQKAHFRKADFLTANIRVSPEPQRLAHDWAHLTRLLLDDGQQLIVVDLTDGAPTQTPSVKAFIPGLIPIKFGAGNEPGGHSAYQLLRQKFATPDRVRGFPHPFN
ncbi:YcaO-like family protein [Achromobacter sp. AGC78]